MSKPPDFMNTVEYSAVFFVFSDEWSSLESLSTVSTILDSGAIFRRACMM